MKKASVLITLILCLFLGTLLFASCGGGSEPATKTEAKTDAVTDAATDAATVPATETETNPATDAATVPATDAATDPTQTEPMTDPATGSASACDHVWDGGTVTKEAGCVVDTKEEIKGEMKYTCTLCGATKTEEIPGHTFNDGKVVSAANCSATGLRLYTCTVCNYRKQEKIPIDPDTHVYKADDNGRVVTPPTETKNGEIEKICTSCGTGVRFATVTYDAYSAQVDALKTEINRFTDDDFGGGSVQSDLGSTYTTPSVKPTKKQHPRVLLTRNDLAAVEAVIHEKRSSTAVYSYYMKYIASPLTNEKATLPTGKLTAGSTNNFSAETLYKIQALALDYQLTKNEVSGYGAIRAMMNCLKTMDFSAIKDDSDLERKCGFVMYTAACVYDWCYSLLSSTDRTRIVLGVQHFCCEGTRMGVGFPPSGQHAIAGHGSEFQILRDYLAFAIAIYDEYPGWWNYIGGRFYQEFVPVRNEYYKAGMYPQGVSIYVRVRYAGDLYAAWLIKAATGTFPYESEENMKQVMRTVYAYELPKGFGFQSGDDHTGDAEFQDFGRDALISSYLFNDSTMRAELEYHKKSYSSFSETITMSSSVVEYLICSSSGVQASTKRHEGMPLIQYNGGWLGQIIARNSWDDDQASVLMKIGCRTTANHDHADAGSFQIWYKTMLAGDTGAYDEYGDEHFKKYHQATIAHNSLMINGSGQKAPGESGNRTTVLTSDYYKTGTVTGYEAGYADEAETTPTYAYIAGDITPAYYDKNKSTSSTVTEVTRRMLTVYDTKNPNIPLYFFVFDNVNAKSASYQKTFLLHVPEEPTVSGKTVTVTKNGAKLVLQSVFGGDSFEAIGGKNNNYNVNGTQIVPTDGGDDGFWGRVEISTSGSKLSQLLNVMYVCDSDKELTLTAKAIETDVVKGAVLGKVGAVFVTSATRCGAAFSFTSPTAVEATYYVSGVKAGNWTVTAGSKTETLTATEDGGLLVVTVAGGATVTLTPQ